MLEATKYQIKYDSGKKKTGLKNPVYPRDQSVPLLFLLCLFRAFVIFFQVRIWSVY